MHPLVEELIGILPPPHDVVPEDPQWDRARDFLGTALPQDYRDFVDRYGGGEIDGELTVLHANDVQMDTGHRDLFADYRRYLVEAIYQDFQFMTPQESPNPYPLYPDPGGLLLWGITLDSNHLFWLTEDLDPDRWPVVVWFRHRAAGERWQRFDEGMAQFLLDRLHDPTGISVELLPDREHHTWERLPT